MQFVYNILLPIVCEKIRNNTEICNQVKTLCDPIHNDIFNTLNKVTKISNISNISNNAYQATTTLARNYTEHSLLTDSAQLTLVLIQRFNLSEKYSPVNCFCYDECVIEDFVTYVKTYFNIDTNYSHDALLSLSYTINAHMLILYESLNKLKFNVHVNVKTKIYEAFELLITFIRKLDDSLKSLFEITLTCINYIKIEKCSLSLISINELLASIGDCCKDFLKNGK